MPSSAPIFSVTRSLELFVLLDAHDRDHVERTGNAVDFGDSLDGEQIVGNALEPRTLDSDENESRNHD